MIHLMEKRMLNFKNIVWYTVVAPLGLVLLLLSLLMLVPVAMLAFMEVLEEIVDRFEAWCFDVARVEAPLWNLFKEAIGRF